MLAGTLDTPWRLTLAATVFEERTPNGQYRRDPADLLDRYIGTAVTAPRHEADTTLGTAPRNRRKQLAAVLETWGEPSTAQQTRMRGKRGDGGDSEGEGRPWCVHHRRHLLAASIDEARLERSHAHEIDRAQGLPIKVKSTRAARKVQLLTGDRHLSLAVDHPSRQGVTRRLAEFPTAELTRLPMTNAGLPTATTLFCWYRPLPGARQVER